MKKSQLYPISTVLAVITCALVPAYVIRWHVGPIPSTVLEASILLTVAAFAELASKTTPAMDSAPLS